MTTETPVGPIHRPPRAPVRAIVVGMEKPAPPEAAPTNPGVQTARQLAHEHEGSMCSEQAHSVDCDHWTRLLEARDRQLEAALAASRARLGEAVGLLKDARDTFDRIASPDHPKPTDRRNWRGWMEVFDFVQRVATNGRARIRAFLASPESTAPPKEPT